MRLHLVNAFATGLSKPGDTCNNIGLILWTNLHAFCKRICSLVLCAFRFKHIRNVARFNRSKKKTRIESKQKRDEGSQKIETNKHTKSECDHNESETHHCIHSACTLWNGLFDYLTLTWHNMTIVINNLISVDWLLCTLCLPFLFD